MKISRLLVLSALWLVGLGANAADLIERVAPTAPEVAPVFGGSGIAVESIDRTPQKFEVGKMYVLYNVAAQKFYYQGCNWATQAAVDDVPLAVRFTLPDGKSLADAQLLFNDYNIYTNSWKQSFFDSATAVFTDLGAQSDFYWQVVDQGNNTYRLQASEANPTLKPSANPGFVGFDVANTTATWDDHGRGASSTAMPISPFLEEGEGHQIDWQFFSVPSELDVWNAYFDAQVVYEKSQQLKTVIEKAEAAGVDVNAAVAVYNNEASTVAEMQAQIDALQSAMTGGIGSGTPDKPADATSLIDNPDFDNASNAGWSGTAPNMTGSGSHGPANVAEHYNKTFDTYQDLGGLPAGVYGLSAYTTYRSSWDDFVNGTDYQTYLYADADGNMVTSPFDNMFAAKNTTAMAGKTDFGTTAAEGNAKDENTGVTYYIPNDPSAARLYFEKGYYFNTLVFNVTGGNARIGVKKDVKVTDTDWSLFDTFRLTYYGNEAASYGAWVADNAQDLVPVGVTCTKSYVDAVLGLIESSKAGATDQASATQAFMAVKNSQELADLMLNISLWGQYTNKVAEASAQAADGSDCAQDLADYVETDAKEYLEAEEKSLTNGELQAEMQKIDQMIEEMKDCKLNQMNPGDDVTSLLKNADYEKGAEGWNGSPVMGNGGGNTCAEAYNRKDFDIYQELSGLQPGVYEIEVQGFFRLGRPQHENGSTNAWAIWSDGQQKAPAWVYLNSALTPLKCIYEEGLAEAEATEIYTQSGIDAPGDGNQYPNTMEQAAQAFAHGMYKSQAFGLIESKEDVMRIGVKGSLTADAAGYEGQNWAIWDNFKLTYRGMDAQYVAPALQTALTNLNVDNETLMGKNVRDEVTTVIGEANAALAGNDGQAQFNALKKVYALGDKVRTSVALFQTLKDAEENFFAILTENPQSPAYTEAYAFFSELYENVNDPAANTYNDEDVPGLIEKINYWITQLNMPATDGASDVNPVDMTSVIRSSDYTVDPTSNESDGTDEGWSGDAGAKGSGAYEFFNKTFNHYQDISGLPAGTYKVGVVGFARYGDWGDDFAHTQEGKGSEAWLYATSQNGSASVFMPTQFSQATTENTGIDGFIPDANNSEQTAVTTDGDGNIWYAPNTMAAFVNYIQPMNDGEPYKYQSEVFVKVGDDQKLRIGVQKNTQDKGNGWVILDHWTLTYYGAESAYEQTGDGIEAVEGASAQKVEFFTVDGRKASQAQKGLMIMKQTLTNGSVIVKKVQK